MTKPIIISQHARRQMILRGAEENEVMKIYYDAAVDALYIELRPLAPGTAEARELSEDLIANYGPDGKLAGLEVLEASSLLGNELRKVNFEISPALAVP